MGPHFRSRHAWRPREPSGPWPQPGAHSSGSSEQFLGQLRVIVSSWLGASCKRAIRTRYPPPVGPQWPIHQDQTRCSNPMQFHTYRIVAAYVKFTRADCVLAPLVHSTLKPCSTLGNAVGHVGWAYGATRATRHWGCTGSEVVNPSRLDGGSESKG